MNNTLRTVAVDLTPVLPGGENGGAKLFVLELLARLAELSPNTEYILLTQDLSHEELAILDRDNMRRVKVVGPVVGNSILPWLIHFTGRIIAYLPRRFSAVFSRLGYKIKTLIKRKNSSGMLQNMRVDLLFCPFTAPTFFDVSIPTVCTIYDLQYKTYPEFFEAEDVAHRNQVFVDACQKATVLTAISDYSRNCALEHSTIEPSRIRTIYLRMAQRIALKAEKNEEILGNLGLTPKKFLFYPANFWKHKNHEILLTAFGIACRGGMASDIMLVCTGAPGERQSYLMRAARIMGLEDRIVFPGYVSNKEIAVLMTECAGVVFPSLYEGFGLPLIEAFASGVPVACSNLTSLPEVAADAAVLFDPRVPTEVAHAMRSIVENEILRQRLIQNGLLRAAEFSDPERMAGEYLELFHYACAHQKEEDLMTGVYSDGWVCPEFTIQVAPAVGNQTLNIELIAPENLAQRNITVQVERNGKALVGSTVIPRGQKDILTLPLDKDGGYFRFIISSHFVPAHQGESDDKRELSAVLENCWINRSGEKGVDLFAKRCIA